ncbi:hypothetical protein J503_4304 [Acinetobacter baumannii 984213]|nr:hypothetical protein J503_4304 [Acinetobacter baumannii 984213]
MERFNHWFGRNVMTAASSPNETGDQTGGLNKAFGYVYQIRMALLHKDLKCKAPLIEPNLRRNLGKWST